MIALDTNILVYAHRVDSEWHDAAARVVRGLAEGDDSWAIPWPCLHEFLAVVTHPRIFKTPTPLELAVAQVDAWFASPTLVRIAETGTYWMTLRALVEPARITGPRVHDARIAAVCQSHAVTELWTADRDFSAFPTLRVRNPLLG